jgi:hypothetical protein
VLLVSPLLCVYVCGKMWVSVDLMVGLSSLAGALGYVSASASSTDDTY